jgi:hypothetical protein
MVALIDDDLTVLSDEVFHPCFVVTALDDGNVYASILKRSTCYTAV